jgi:hypothetical protein
MVHAVLAVVKAQSDENVSVPEESYVLQTVIIC